MQAALSAVPDASIDAALEELSPEAQDVLMKYLYRLLARPSNSLSLLKWHEKLVARAGLGSVVRALVDRKTV